MPKGGYGITPYGRSEYGNAASAVEPRFSISMPFDGEGNVARDRRIKFEVYCYSSYIPDDEIRLEISINGGSTYLPLYDGTSFLLPFEGKIRRPDGHRIWVYVTNTELWPVRKEIIIRFTGSDEFGQGATKVTPVKWE